MAVLHSCASCGLLGWRLRRRARWAAEVADAGLVAFFAALAHRAPTPPIESNSVTGNLRLQRAIGVTREFRESRTR